MAHKTLIGGTSYEISGGKTLVNGTAYEIKNGKTVVGGTAYEIGFNCIVFITSTADLKHKSYASVTIDGKTYDGSEDIELVVPNGTIATCYACTTSFGTIFHHPAFIAVNGTYVAKSEPSEEEINYPYKITKDVTIDVGSEWVGGIMGADYDDRGRIVITEH